MNTGIAIYVAMQVREHIIIDGDWFTITESRVQELMAQSSKVLSIQFILTYKCQGYEVCLQSL